MRIRISCLAVVLAGTACDRSDEPCPDERPPVERDGACTCSDGSTVDDDACGLAPPTDFGELEDEDDAQTREGALGPDNQRDSLVFELPGLGSISIELSADAARVRARLFLTSVDDETPFYRFSAPADGETLFEIDVPGGAYRLDLESAEATNYTVRVRNEDYPLDEPEPDAGDEPDTARDLGELDDAFLVAGGYIGYDDPVDMVRVSAPSDGTLTLRLTPRTARLAAELWTEDAVEDGGNGLALLDAQPVGPATLDTEVSAGVYYVELTSEADIPTNYTLEARLRSR